MDNARAKRTLANRWDSLAELEAVRVFAAVAELRSFRGAANALRIPRSTVSRRIAELETAIETRLLQRTTRQVSLTEAGDAFLTQVTPALGMIADAGRTMLDARAAPRGALRVTAPAATVERIGGILLELLARYPEIRLELDFSDRHVDLIGEGFDIAVRPGALADSSLVVRPLGTGGNGYYASRAYLKAHGEPKQPRDLANHACIVFTGTSRGGRWLFQTGKRREEVAVPRTIVCNDLGLVRLAAIAGHGIAWLPEPLASAALARKQLVPVLEHAWPAPTPLQIVYPSARHLAPQVRVAVELLVERLKAGF